MRSPSSCPWAELVELVCVLFLGLRPFVFFPFFSFFMLNNMYSAKGFVEKTRGGLSGKSQNIVFFQV